MKIDNFYRFIASTFGLSYFLGIIIGVFYSINGKINTELLNTKLFFLSNTINFRTIFTENIFIGIEKALIPFSYLIDSVKFGLSHSYLLTSTFLGQIKLLVQLIPEIFYFITFIIFATIGLKLIILIIIKLVNILFDKTNSNIQLNLNLFTKEDILFFYLALISLAIGVFIQVYLAKVFFIFLINFQLVSYVFIIVAYIILIVISLLIIYKTILSLLDGISKLHKKIIYK